MDRPRVRGLGEENGRNSGRMGFVSERRGRVAGMFRVHCFALGTLALLVLALAGISMFGRDQEVWREWRPSVEFLRPIYAERIHSEDVFRTRANTWSNLAYVLVGLYGIGIGWRDRKVGACGGYLARTPGWSFAFGVACCYLGAGSGLFHASLTRFGQHLDVAAMYAPLSVLIGLSLGRRLPGRIPAGRSRGVPTAGVLMALVVAACVLLFVYKWSMSMPLVLGALILATFVLGVYDARTGARRLDIRWVFGSVAALAAGIVCRQTEIAEWWFTDPDTWMQGHSLWHGFTAMSLGCMYLFYRLEAGLEGGAGGG